MVKKTIKTFIITETFVLLTYLYSFMLFINVQVAFISALFVILGSSFAYKKMIKSQIDSDSYEDKRDLLDEIEDPHELYDDEPINNTPIEELDFKSIVKEEKAKIKTFSLSSIKHGARGSISAFRIIPYIFLVLGFIALKNNEILDLIFYLPSLFIGIIVGSLISREIVS